jgi:hypothetical protein
VTLAVAVADCPESKTFGDTARLTDRALLTVNSEAADEAV